jgi:hypothetical protein
MHFAVELTLPERTANCRGGNPIAGDYDIPRRPGVQMDLSDSRVCGRREVVAGVLFYMTGIEKSAPARMPVGQREVTVFNRV